MRGWWKSRNRAVENPTAFTRNPMKRFQTPTSRNPVMVRRRAENRTWRVRKSILLKYGNLTKWQDDFHACMVEQYPDLERGESASKTGRKHIPTRLFKQAVNLSKQARAIEAVLSGITPLNAGKKKEEALSMLKKWFPQMENFSGQLKKYKVTINDLLAENEKLEVRAKASEKGKMNDTMERAKLKSELDDMRRLVDRIPPEILAELKRQQRQHGKER